MAAEPSTVTVDGHEVPAGWTIDDFELEVAELRAGKWDDAARLLREAAGWAWLRLPCARPPIFTLGKLDRPDVSVLRQAVEVVSEVSSSQTQISLADAQRFRPDVQLGETLAVEMAVDRSDLQEIVNLGRGVRDWLDTDPMTARFQVEFSDLTVSFDDRRSRIGRIEDGTVAYPATRPIKRPYQGPIEIDIDGFVLDLSSIELSLRGRPPWPRYDSQAGIADVDSCQPATIDLGVITMSPTCDFYVDAPATRPTARGCSATPAWSSKAPGYVLDLSASLSPAPWPPAWHGLALGAGTATGEKYVPDPCNTGYLRGHYTYTDAIVVASGFFGTLYLTDPCTFGALNPLGQTFTFDDGAMDVWSSADRQPASSGTGGPSSHRDAVCDAGRGSRGDGRRSPPSTCSPTSTSPAWSTTANREISWGELTRHGDEVVAWTARVGRGYLYLPAGPYPSLLARSRRHLLRPAIDSVARRQPQRARGRTTRPACRSPSCTTRCVFSPDRPGGTRQPDQARAPCRGGCGSASPASTAQLAIYVQSQPEELGDPKRPATSATSRSGEAVRQRQEEPARRVRHERRPTTPTSAGRFDDPTAVRHRPSATSRR